jgi:hypothetical protein
VPYYLPYLARSATSTGRIEILQILSLPFCMQNKFAITPEVCCRNTWAIIVNTRSFFDDIKLADDFLEQG